MRVCDVTFRERIHDSRAIAERKFDAALARHRWPLNAALGFLVGLGLPVIPDALKAGVGPLLQAFFSSFWLSLLTVAALVTVGAYAALQPVIGRRIARDTLDARLLTTFSSYVDPIFQSPEIQLEGLAWGKGQTYLACPTPDDGWRSTEIALTATGPAYSFDELRHGFPTLRERDLEGEYQQFLAGDFSDQFGDDRTRLLLTGRPRSFSDDKQLRLGLRPVKWSQLQFFWQRISSTELLPELVRSAFTSPINPFPSSLCLHLVVHTRDGKVLLTKAHPSKKNDYPLTWACSLGEQLDPEDLHGDRDGALAWARRALFEELSIDPSTVTSQDVKYLALTIEGDICNFAMIALVNINETAETLGQRLKTVTRKDNEFSAVDFIDVEGIPDEMLNPSREYHPSTAIRMAYAHIHLRGQSALRRALDDRAF